MNIDALTRVFSEEIAKGYAEACEVGKYLQQSRNTQAKVRDSVVSIAIDNTFITTTEPEFNYWLIEGYKIFDALDV